MTGKELQDWTAQAKRWALTGDRSALPMFRPALRDRRQVPGQEGLSIHGYGGTGGLDPAGDWPPLRVCDFALEAVLTVLDGPEKGRALSFVDGTPPQSPADAKAWAAAARDRRRAAPGRWRWYAEVGQSISPRGAITCSLNESCVQLLRSMAQGDLYRGV